MYGDEMYEAFLQDPGLDNAFHIERSSNNKHLEEIKNTIRSFQLMKNTNTVNTKRIIKIKEIDHRNSIASFSYDSQYLALSCEEDSVVIWDISRSKKEIISYHGATIKSIKFGNTSHCLASASEDGKAKFWKDSIRNKEKIYDFQAHEEGVECIAISPKDNYLAAGSLQNKMTVWNVKDFDVKIDIEESSKVNDIIFSHDEEIVITGLENMEINLWELKTNNIIYRLKGHENPIKSFAITKSSIGNLLASSSENEIKIWNLDKIKIYFSLTENENHFSNVSFSADGKHLAVGFSIKNSVTIWNVEDKTIESAIDENISSIEKVLFCRNGKYLLCLDYEEIILQILACKEKKVIFRSPKKINFIALNSLGMKLAIGGEDLKVNIIDLNNTDENIFKVDCKQPIMSLCFGNSQRFINHLVYGLKDGSVVIIDTSTKKEITKFNFKNPIYVVAFSMDDKLLAVTHTISCNIIIKKIQDLGRIEEIILSGHSEDVKCLAFTYDNKFLLSGSEDKTIIMWELATFKEYRKFKEHTDWVNSISISRTGLFASASSDKRIIIWNLDYSRKEFPLTGHTGKITSVSFSHCGEFLISGSFDNSIKIWNIKEKRLEFSVFGNTDNIISVLFLPDKSGLISASDDKTIKLWNFNINVNYEHEISLYHENIKIDDLVCSPCRKYSVFRKENEHRLGAVKGTVKVNLENYNPKEWTCYFNEKSMLVVKNTNNNSVKCFNPKTGNLVENVTGDLADVHLKEFSQYFEPGYQDVLNHKNLVKCLKSGTLKDASVHSLGCTVGLGKFTGVHIAAFKGLHNIIQKLIDKPVIPLKTDKKGYSPLRYSIERQNQQCTDLILKYIILLSENPQSSIFIASLHAIRKDIFLIIQDSSKYLQDFFNCCMHSYTDQIQFREPNKSLPIILVQNTWTASINDFIKIQEFASYQNKDAKSKILANQEKQSKKVPLLLKFSRIPFKGIF